MIHERTVLQHELIGMTAEITTSTNPLNLGRKGVVGDETNHSLVIEHNMKDKTIFKKASTITFNLPNKKRVEVKGSLLEGRPWDRIKKRW